MQVFVENDMLGSLIHLSNEHKASLMIIWLEDSNFYGPVCYIVQNAEWHVHGLIYSTNEI